MLLLLARLALAEPAEDDGVDETIVVTADALREARAAVAAAMAAEGYTRQKRRGDETIFIADEAWKPRVLVTDEALLDFRPQPPRLHPPGQDFAGQGPNLAWAKCLLAPFKCVSAGSTLTRLTDQRVVERRQDAIVRAVTPSVAALREVVIDQHAAERVARDIPARCAEIWEDPSAPAAERRARLFAYWDERTETPQGEAARDAILAFVNGVVQASEEPFTDEEIERYNASRDAERTFAPRLVAAPGGAD